MLAAVLVKPVIGKGAIAAGFGEFPVLTASKVFLFARLQSWIDVAVEPGVETRLQTIGYVPMRWIVDRVPHLIWIRLHIEKFVGSAAHAQNEFPTRIAQPAHQAVLVKNRRFAVPAIRFPTDMG